MPRIRLGLGLGSYVVASLILVSTPLSSAAQSMTAQPLSGSASPAYAPAPAAAAPVAAPPAADTADKSQDAARGVLDCEVSPECPVATRASDPWTSSYVGWDIDTGGPGELTVRR